MTEREIEEKMVREALDTLSQHFESVRVFVTNPGRNSCKEWTAFSEGRGNYYAQFGQIEDWIERQRERTRIDERQSAEANEED